VNSIKKKRKKKKKTTKKKNKKKTNKNMNKIEEVHPRRTKIYIDGEQSFYSHTTRDVHGRRTEKPPEKSLGNTGPALGSLGEEKGTGEGRRICRQPGGH